MNLSIYIVVAYYVSKGNLAQVVSGWTPNLLVCRSNPLSSKKMEHCSGSDPRWPHDISREISYLSPNHLYIARNCRFLARNTKISSDRYFSMKYCVKTLRYTIFSSMSGMKWTLPKNQGDPHRDTSGTQTHLRQETITKALILREKYVSKSLWSHTKDPYSL